MKNITCGWYFLALILGFHTMHLPHHSVFRSSSSPVLVSLKFPVPDSEFEDPLP